MTFRIAINGFGRIGRTVTRILAQRHDVEVVGINDLTTPDALAHSLKYDSVFGKFKGDIRCEGDRMFVNAWNIRMTAEKDPTKLDWAALQVDAVVESTGRFKKRIDLEKHLEAGAPLVVLSVPPKDALDATIVMGVNDGTLTGRERLVSNASCTTNAAAPVTKVIHEAFGIQKGFINTIHAYTNDQRLVDFPHEDWRRSRSAALAVIPTTTGAAKAVAAVIPALKGKLDGSSYRIPVPNGSIVDMVFTVEKPTTADEVNHILRQAAEGPMRGIIQYETDPIVSVDIIGNSYSSIFDSQLTQVVDGDLVRVAAWYDNEWGYSSRLVELMLKLSAMKKEQT